MKYSFIILILFLSGSLLSAQEIVSSNGDTQSAAGYELSWTVGEVVIETLIGGTNSLTQGFHQAENCLFPVWRSRCSRIPPLIFSPSNSVNILKTQDFSYTISPAD